MYLFKYLYDWHMACHTNRHLVETKINGFVRPWKIYCGDPCLVTKSTNTIIKNYK